MNVEQLAIAFSVLAQTLQELDPGHSAMIERALGTIRMNLENLQNQIEIERSRHDALADVVKALADASKK